MVYKERTAVEIVKEYFGADVAKVYSFLVYRGKSSLKIINQSIEDMNHKKIKKSLLVLVQHNLVYFEEYLSDKYLGEERLTDAIYEANIANAIHRLRFPKFINYIKEYKNEDAVIIIEELMDHGRLTMENVISQSVVYYSQNSETYDMPSLNKRFEEIFNSLIIDQFIMRVAIPKIKSDSEMSSNISSDAKNEQRETSAFTLPAGSFKSISAASNNNVLSDLNNINNNYNNNNNNNNNNNSSGHINNLVPNIPMEIEQTSTTTQPKKPTPSKSKKTQANKKRKNVGDDNEEMPDLLLVSESAPVDIVENENSLGQPPKKKATIYTVISPEEQQQRIINDEKKVLWTINYSQFILEFKLKACFDFVVQKNNLNSGLLFNSMIKLCKKSLKANQDTMTTVIYGENILAEFNSKLEPNDRMEIAEFKNYLMVMQATRPPIVTKMQSKSKQSTASDLGAYQVNVGMITQQLKQKLVESIIRQKYSEPGLRVFKLLLIKNYLEVKNIAELAMIPMKECKKLLFDMLSSNVLRLQEIPRSNDHFANRTFYLFYVDYQSLLSTLTEHIFKAIYNTRERLNLELAPHKELIEKLMNNTQETSEDQSKIGKRVQRITEVLETVVMNLDNDLLYLFDF
ncbi:RNA polymerase III subunit [Tieghemostelium lacteum]|uniref:DNA-directed RNA polymerase III subunit RPC3 n=1 Tax=Tieghemostelium lacteum TaxID=361077 RepID=A0A152A9M4_TIELA|nr:RNA polymerase III subunit [Tieghemostelium lacteum]|eukprot:KYR02914.1 RNA polymerase III subunit [Tieghemostelium lacteum]